MNDPYNSLGNKNFTAHSLDGFVLRRTVTESGRKAGKEWTLVPNVYEENWSQAACRALGCTPAGALNEALAAAEPFDVQMEYRL